MTAEQMARAASFLRDLNDAVEAHGVHFEDVGGYDKQLTLVLNGEKRGMFGSNSYLVWAEDHYEIGSY